jgi:dihydroflavonol-4-reductase
MPDWLLRAVALFDPVVRQVVGELGNIRDASADHAREKLGWVPRPPEESVLDTARDMIRLGIVKV